MCIEHHRREFFFIVSVVIFFVLRALVLNRTRVLYGLSSVAHSIAKFNLIVFFFLPFNNKWCFYMYKYIYPSIIMLRTCFFVFRFPVYPSRLVRKIYDYQCVTIVVLLTINVLRFKMRAYIK